MDRERSLHDELGRRIREARAARVKLQTRLGVALNLGSPGAREGERGGQRADSGAEASSSLHFFHTEVVSRLDEFLSALAILRYESAAQLRELRALAARLEALEQRSDQDRAGSGNPR